MRVSAQSPMGLGGRCSSSAAVVERRKPPKKLSFGDSEVRYPSEMATGDRKIVPIPCLLEEAACGERWGGELQQAREGLADSFSGIVLGAERPYLLKALGWVKMSEAIFFLRRKDRRGGKKEEGKLSQDRVGFNDCPL